MSKKMNSGLVRFVLGLLMVAALCIGCNNERQKNSRAGSFWDAIPIEIKNSFPQVSAPESADVIAQEMPAQFSSQGFNLLPGQIHLGETSGEELYLLPNSNYVHVEWADIQLPTVDETGSWKITNGVVELTPLHTRKWTRMTDRNFVGIFFPVEGKRILLLMGNQWNLSRFKGQKGSKENFDLFLHCMTCVRHLNSIQMDYLSKCQPEQEIPDDLVFWEKPINKTQ